MSERLSDEQIDGMLLWHDEEELPAFAMYCGPVAARELRERRAADLTGEEMDALRFLRGDIMLELSHVEIPPERETALVRARSTLDKLLAGGGR